MIKFEDILKQVKSYDNVILNFNSDTSGQQYFGYGFDISFKFNNITLYAGFDCYVLYENSSNWDDAKNSFFREECEEILENYNQEIVNSFNENTKHLAGYSLYNIYKNIVNQIESIANKYEFDLDAYVSKNYTPSFNNISKTSNSNNNEHTILTIDNFEQLGTYSGKFGFGHTTLEILSVNTEVIDNEDICNIKAHYYGHINDIFDNNPIENHYSDEDWSNLNEKAVNENFEIYFNSIIYFSIDVDTLLMNDHGSKGISLTTSEVNNLNVTINASISNNENDTNSDEFRHIFANNANFINAALKVLCEFKNEFQSPNSEKYIFRECYEENFKLVNI